MVIQYRPEDEAADDEMCGVCGANSVDDDMFCYGCHTFVCPHCDMNQTLIGRHDADEHLFEEDENGE